MQKIEPNQLSPQPKTFNLGRGFKSYYWDFPHSFDINSQNFLYSTITQLASAVFGDDMSPYWKKKEEQGFLQTVSRLSIVVDKNNNPIGWTALVNQAQSNPAYFYLDATGVLPHLQRTGIMRRLMTYNILCEIVKIKFKTCYLVMRTENPTIYSGFLNVVGTENIFPRLDGSLPGEVKVIAEQVAEKLKQREKLEIPSLRIVNAFDGPCPWRWTKDLKPLKAKGILSDNAKVNGFFSTILRPEDTFIVLVKISIRSVIKGLFQNIKSYLWGKT